MNSIFSIAAAPFFVTLVNGITLIVLGSWGYVGRSGSPTALIPVALGIAFLCLAPGVKTYNKAIAHIVVFLALMTLAALVPPLLRVMGAGNTMAIARILGMLLTTGIALGFYVKSFIDARRSRPKTESEDTEINEEV